MKMRQYIKEHTTNVWAYRKDMDARLLADKIQVQFQDQYGINFQDLEQTPELQENIEKLSDYRDFSIVKNSAEEIKSKSA